MSKIFDWIKSTYYQFVNFIHGINPFVYATIWVVILGFTFWFIMEFFKSFDEEKKRYKKPSRLVWGLIFLVLIILFTYLRK